jgi:hypothetical protein
MIPMENVGGVYQVPIRFNDTITLDAIVDSGATDVGIPADVVLTLIRSKTISSEDFIGTRTYMLADGSIMVDRQQEAHFDFELIKSRAPEGHKELRLKSLVAGSDLEGNHDEHDGKSVSLWGVDPSRHVWSGQLRGCSDLRPPVGLVGWWPGNGNASDFADGNNGTLANGATFAAGRVGQAFSLDGVNDYVLLGNPADLRLQNFTIDAWVKLATRAIPPTSCPVVVGYGQEGFAFGISSGSARCQSPRGGPGMQRLRELFLKVGINAVYQKVIIPDTDWHHVAVTKSEGAVVFYLDGVGTTAAVSYDPGFSFSTDLSIGIRADILEDAFHGLIDEGEIYNRALSASEILTIFNAGSAGKCRASSVLDHFKCYEVKKSTWHWRPSKCNRRSPGRVWRRLKRPCGEACILLQSCR